MGPRDDIHQRFTAALESLVAEITHDRSILAAILCGSLSHDTVWAKSDIELVLITIDDVKAVAANDAGRALYADGVNIHALLMTRAEFRKAVEGSARNSFTHSFLAKGRLLYSHDPTIAGLAATLAGIGARDTQLQVLRAATYAVVVIYKAHKFFVTRGDLDYTALWILHAATPLAQVEVFGRRLLADREVIPQALALNPAFFATIYTELLNAKKSRAKVQAALDAIDGYMNERASTVFEPVIAYLREAGDVRSCAEIEAHFARTFGIEGVTSACEYLADQGLIGKASAPARLTKRSTVQVQELAFFAIG